MPVPTLVQYRGTPFRVSSVGSGYPSLAPENRARQALGVGMGRFAAGRAWWTDHPGDPAAGCEGWGAGRAAVVVKSVQVTVTGTAEMKARHAGLVTIRLARWMSEAERLGQGVCTACQR